MSALPRVLSEATSPSLVDTNGNIVQKGMVDAQLALLARISGKAYDTARKTELCSTELDPESGARQVALGNLVTPMSGANGQLTETPLEVIADTDRRREPRGARERRRSSPRRTMRTWLEQREPSS